MSISGINNYNNVLFQWQGQQLKGSTSSGSKSSSSSSLESLFGNTSMTSQLSSMVELTKYAMDAMGLGSDSRVTFNQITVNSYRPSSARASRTVWPTWAFRTSRA